MPVTLGGATALEAGPPELESPRNKSSTTRPSADQIQGWLYDLRLLARLAARLDPPPLPAVLIGPAWRVPYGSARPLTASRRGSEWVTRPDEATGGEGA
jgi:hypothetical protein